nr:MAG TPA: hypothetical protein [Caudoviricetes sp.]
MTSTSHCAFLGISIVAFTTSSTSFHTLVLTLVFLSFNSTTFEF